MKIAYVLGSFPVLSETFIGNEIRGMQDVGCDVEIISFDRPDKPAQPEDETLAEQACYMPQLAKPSWRMPSLAALTFCYKQTQLPTLSLYYNALKLAYHIKQRGCTHIHTHFAWGNSAHAIVAAKLLGLPVTMTCHGSDVVATPQDIALKVKSVDAVITVSEPLADRLKAFASTPVHIVPCGVNTDVFSPSKSKEHRHAGEGQYLEQQDSGLRQKDGLCDNGKLLFIGRLMDCKGVDDLLHALAIAPNPPVLDIVGDGALRPELEALRDR